MAKQRVIFFDVGNTLLFPNRAKMLAPISSDRHPTLEQWQALERRTKTEFDQRMQGGGIDHSFWWTFHTYLLQDLGEDASVRDSLVENTQNSANWDQILPGTRDALTRIGQNFRIAVISNADGGIQRVLARCGIADCFENIIDSGILGVEKPRPEIFEVALKAMKTRAEESLRLTMAWARRSLDHFHAHRDEVLWRDEFGGQTQSLFGIVQGGMYHDLRRESAERLVEMNFDGYAIGGLSVGEPRELTLEVISEVLPLLPKDKPRYVMGVGYPDEIEQYARMGVDMMDCVLPTRAARHGLLFTSQGRVNIKNKQYAEDQGPADPACNCMVCRRYSRAYLRHLIQCGEPLAGTLNTIHNLAYYLGIMERVRKDLAPAPADVATTPFRS